MASTTPSSVVEIAPFRLPSEPDELDMLGKYFRGLGDPTRLQILELIADRERSVGELVDRIQTTQPRVSNHLAVLRWCGFVSTRREHRTIFYRVADERVNEIIRAARELLRANEEHQAAVTSRARAS
jgi:DNA-binding transcriptional ArsR family regulator